MTPWQGCGHQRKPKWEPVQGTAWSSLGHDVCKQKVLFLGRAVCNPKVLGPDWGGGLSRKAAAWSSEGFGSIPSIGESPKK